jgi:hypothetical protein
VGRREECKSLRQRRMFCACDGACDGRTAWWARPWANVLDLVNSGVWRRRAAATSRAAGRWGFREGSCWQRRPEEQPKREEEKKKREKNKEALESEESPIASETNVAGIKRRRKRGRVDGGEGVGGCLSEAAKRRWMEVRGSRRLAGIHSHIEQLTQKDRQEGGGSRGSWVQLVGAHPGRAGAQVRPSPCYNLLLAAATGLLSWLGWLHVLGTWPWRPGCGGRQAYQVRTCLVVGGWVCAWACG